MKYILITGLMIGALVLFFMDNNRPVVRSVIEHPTADANIPYEAGVKLAKGCAAELRSLESDLTDAASRAQYAAKAVEIKKNCRQQINRLYNEGDSQPGMPLVLPVIPKTPSVSPPVPNSPPANTSKAERLGEGCWRLTIHGADLAKGFIVPVTIPETVREVSFYDHVGRLVTLESPNLDTDSRGIGNGKCLPSNGIADIPQPSVNCGALVAYVQNENKPVYVGPTSSLETVIPRPDNGILRLGANVHTSSPHDIMPNSMFAVTARFIY